MQKKWSETELVRALIAEDLGSVARIEGAELSAWSYQQIKEEIDREDSIARVVCVAGEPVGWVCCRFLDAEAELLKIGVIQSHRRKGLATTLLTSLSDSLAEQGIAEVYLEVRAQNTGAVKFYQSHGFTAVGKRLKYYSQPQDDALVLKKNITRQSK